MIEVKHTAKEIFFRHIKHASPSKLNQIPLEKILIFLTAGQEDHLMFLCALFDQFTGLLHAIFIHIREGIIQNDDTTAIREKIAGEFEQKAAAYWKSVDAEKQQEQAAQTAEYGSSRRLSERDKFAC